MAKGVGRHFQRLFLFPNCTKFFIKGLVAKRFIVYLRYIIKNMALNRKMDFQADEIALADLAKAIAHPARIAILKILAQQKSCICGEIVEGLPLAQATVSQHLKELKAIGLIKGTIEGKTSCYCIDWQVFNQFINQFGAFAELAKNAPNQSQSCC
jgi:ArsR family transcriptional regulator, arsenate/arsenite/antimonite-responsive transcriptional repressor